MGWLSVSDRLKTIPQNASAEILGIPNVDPKLLPVGEKPDSGELSNYPELATVVSHIGSAVNFTLGIVAVSEKPIETASIDRLVMQLSKQTKRTTMCLCEGPNQDSVLSSRELRAQRNRWLPSYLDLQPLKRRSSYEIDMSLTGWSYDPTTASRSGSTVIRLNQLPSLKTQCSLIVVCLSSLDSAGTDQLGRLCDGVYLWVPKSEILSIRKSTRSIRRLAQSGISIRGTWCA